MAARRTSHASNRSLNFNIIQRNTFGGMPNSWNLRPSVNGKRPLIVDAGANIGASAAFFAMTYPTAKIVAIEPEATISRSCCRTRRGSTLSA